VSIDASNLKQNLIPVDILQPEKLMYNKSKQITLIITENISTTFKALRI
jgi:hypothetical protein